MFAHTESIILSARTLIDRIISLFTYRFMNRIIILSAHMLVKLNYNFPGTRVRLNRTLNLPARMFVNRIIILWAKMFINEMFLFLIFCQLRHH
jgi:hypothetical protein